MTYVMRSGGTKKYLYTGGRRETEEEQSTFIPKTIDSKPIPGVPVDLNGVWSIQKNVSLVSHSSRAPDRLNHNVNKGFYSRHGGMKGGKNAKPPEKTDVGSAWSLPRGSSLSFSYTAQETGNCSNPASSRQSERRRQSEGPAGPLDDRDL
ncbi:uncharacterized protein LOC143297771 isoform X4 [Babylonia areolata]|uniref:uncharacterized protein LOC143297771 isoform X4 n=1 Tax=Babylonia areolata TaxID=304850 RepID=UPI003FD3C217